MASWRPLIALCCVAPLLAGCGAVGTDSAASATPGSAAVPATEQELFKAVEDGQLAAVRAALDAHPDWVRSRAHRWEVPPLAIACDRGHLEIARLLLDRGADVNAFNERWLWRPVHEAAAQGHTKIVRLLIERGADLSVTNHEGLTPLFMAAQGGHTETIRLLLEHGATVDARGPGGWTLMHMAAIRGDAALAEAMLAKGVKAGATSDDGRTPLFWSASRPVAELLIGKGADVNARDNFGRRPLHLAAMFGRTNVAAALMDRGAEVNPADACGTTPLDLAVAEDQKAAADLLRKRGAATGKGQVGHAGLPATRTHVGPRGQVYVDGRPTIPVGPWQQPPRLFAYHRSLGMNCLIWPPSGGYDDESSTAAYVRPAQGLGMGVILHYRDELVREPGVWGWVGGGWPVENALRRYEMMRRNDPHHLIQVNFGGHGLIRNEDTDFYRAELHYVDSIVVHVWPEMFEGEPRNLRYVAAMVDNARKLCADRPRGEASIWADLSLHQWFEKEAKGGWKFPAPTPEEFKFQVWLALIHGADGICIFPISFDPFVYSQIPAKIEESLPALLGEVGRFAAALCADESPRRITVTGKATDGIVDVTTRRLDGKDYVFVLNGTAQPQRVRLATAGLGKELRLRDAVKDALLEAAGGAYEDDLVGLELRIWQLTPAGGGG